MFASKISQKLVATCFGANRQFATAGKSKLTFQYERPTKFHKLEGASLSKEVEATGDELMQYFKDMYTIRRMEVAADNLYKQKKIYGFLHLYNGQEGVCTGICAGLTENDAIVTAYRDHGYMYLRGGTVFNITAEMLGKSSGCSGGKGGSMHMFNPEQKFFGGHAIVGAQVPLGAGIGMSYKYLKTGGVAVAAYGDGAANQGQVFEAFNMAQLWDLPVIFLCENNDYGMGTSTKRAAADIEFYKRGAFVPGVNVDGMDVLAVKQATEYCAEYAREKGPIILETNTYRYVGHSMSDPGTTYRDRSEVEQVRKAKDPIEAVKSRILSTEVATEKELKELEKTIRKEVDKAVKDAQAAPDPEANELYTDILKENISVRNVDRTASFEV